VALVRAGGVVFDGSRFALAQAGGTVYLRATPLDARV
jgi:hypothetical protein